MYPPMFFDTALFPTIPTSFNEASLLDELNKFERFSELRKLTAAAQPADSKSKADTGSSASNMGTAGIVFSSSSKAKPTGAAGSAGTGLVDTANRVFIIQ